MDHNWLEISDKTIEPLLQSSLDHLTISCLDSLMKEIKQLYQEKLAEAS